MHGCWRLSIQRCLWTEMERVLHITDTDMSLVCWDRGTVVHNTQMLGVWMPWSGSCTEPCCPQYEQGMYYSMKRVTVDSVLGLVGQRRCRLCSVLVV